jgi:hypothetical protein
VRPRPRTTTRVRGPGASRIRSAGSAWRRSSRRTRAAVSLRTPAGRLGTRGDSGGVGRRGRIGLGTLPAAERASERRLRARRRPPRHRDRDLPRSSLVVVTARTCRHACIPDLQVGSARWCNLDAGQRSGATARESAINSREGCVDRGSVRLPTERNRVRTSTYADPAALAPCLPWYVGPHRMDEGGPERSRRNAAEDATQGARSDAS